MHSFFFSLAPSFLTLRLVEPQTTFFGWGGWFGRRGVYGTLKREIISPLILVVQLPLSLLSWPGWKEKSLGSLESPYAGFGAGIQIAKCEIFMLAEEEFGVSKSPLRSSPPLSKLWLNPLE